ncbi:hypothetical protein ABIF66_011054 [Bradyrhizobium japonicum]
MSSPAVNTPEPPGDDHAADVGVVLRGVDRAAHLAIHVLRDRVLLARTAQGDDARSALFGDDDIAIRHESPLRSPRRLPLASLASLSLHHLAGVPIRPLDLFENVPVSPPHGALSLF